MHIPSASPDTDPRELLQEMVAHGAGNTPDAIMLRLLWLRQEHPEAKVDTGVVQIVDNRIVMQATISLVTGASGSGIAAAVADGEAGWAEVVERTETIAISRALDTLGYVLRAVVDRELPSQDVPEAPQSASEPEPRAETAPPAPDIPTRSHTPESQEAAPPVVNALRRAQRPATPEPPAPAEAAGQDEVPLEEYSWNSFWARARELGLTPDRVTELLGQPAPSMTPREAVQGLLDAGAWPRDGES